MKKLASFAVGVIAPALILTGGMAGSAIAQDKAAKAAPTMKVVLENDKVRAFEITFKPGDENTSVPSSSPRVVRALKAGTLQRIYADGKKEDVVWNTGDVRFNPPSPVAYNTKNVGKAELQLYVVVLK